MRRRISYDMWLPHAEATSMPSKVQCSGCGGAAADGMDA